MEDILTFEIEEIKNVSQSAYIYFFCVNVVPDQLTRFQLM